MIYAGIAVFGVGFIMKSPWAGLAGLALVTIALIMAPGKACELDGTCEKNRPKLKIKL